MKRIERLGGEALVKRLGHDAPERACLIGVSRDGFIGFEVPIAFYG
jgi:hypothetical protein